MYFLLSLRQIGQRICLKQIIVHSIHEHHFIVIKFGLFILFVLIVYNRKLPKYKDEHNYQKNNCNYEVYDSKNRTKVEIHEISSTIKGNVLDCDVESYTDSIWGIFRYKCTKLKFAFPTGYFKHTDK